MNGQLPGTDVIEEVSDDDTSEDEVQLSYSVSQPHACPPPDSSHFAYRHSNLEEIMSKKLFCWRYYGAKAALRSPR